MKNNFFFLLLMAIVISISGCKRTFNKTDKEIIASIADKFPEIKKASLNSSDAYLFTKSLTLAKPAVQIKFYEAKSKSNDIPAILILTNPAGVSYPIPILDNKFASYWGFVYGNYPTKNPIHVTFEKEINKALDTLGLNMGFDGSKIIEEIFQALLNCKRLGDDDVAGMKKVEFVYYESDLPADNEDSCKKRNAENLQAIARSMHPEKYEISENAFLDDKNSRIYQVDFSAISKGVKNNYKIAIYWQGCIVRSLEL